IGLKETARDEFHVVEAVTEDSESRTAVPLATLKPSVQPTVTLGGMKLNPPVTFRLRAGSGPVYISGNHVSGEFWGSPPACPVSFGVPHPQRGLGAQPRTPTVTILDLDGEEEEEEEIEEAPKNPPTAQRSRTAK
ncbi:hypothetical protein IHE44_0010451, partial [Lamprotornis superbus]